ncbi:MAG: polysaccharide deacetylase family protein [Oscillospiraceae bacterium]|jgi:peptidoglycan/xylan/chitin deacetylase (PgdA/CDA1 family)|nr:polysaccharide deacetylase family protein [Oscillospiraceae bacterium]
MYHSLTKRKRVRKKYVVSVNLFKEDLKYIKDNGYTTIWIQDLIDYVENKKDLPEKPIILTFDDGFYNNYLYAFPLIREYNCKMVISPIAKEIDRYSFDISDSHTEYAYCTWSQLKEMTDSKLVEVQNHSYNMHRVRGRNGVLRKKSESLDEYKKKLSEDFKSAQRKIEEEAGVTPTAFTYPLGAINKESMNILKGLGCKVFLNCEEKINKITRNNPKCLYNLKRFLRTYKKSSENYFKTKIERSMVNAK